MAGTVHFGIVQRMTAPRQGDLFGNDGPDPSDNDFETPVYYPDPEKVREELHRILGEARAAKTIPLGREPDGALSHHRSSDGGLFAVR
jgi:hypothetical protein